MTDYWFNTTYGCGLVTIDRKDKIVGTCPIYKWMIGNDFNYVINYLITKRQYKGNKVINTYLSESEKLDGEHDDIKDINLSEYKKLKKRKHLYLVFSGVQCRNR